MARRGMSFFMYNRLKIIAAVSIVIIVVLILRLPHWWDSFPVTDVEHGPLSDGLYVPVTITVFYEALCPDSKSFVVKQLRPVVEKMPSLVSTNFVPYGKATTKVSPAGNITFECQHGPTECFANKVHSCVVNMVPEQTTRVEYVACMIADNYDPIGIGKMCAKRLKIDWDPIEHCSKTRAGDLLLQHNGELTHDLRPSVKFIPTILLDDSQSNQAGILKNLLKEVCSHFKVLPKECQNDEKAAS